VLEEHFVFKIRVTIFAFDFNLQQYVH